MNRRAALRDAARWALAEDDAPAAPPPLAGDVQTTLDDPALAEALEQSAAFGRLSDDDILAMRTARRRGIATLGTAMLVAAVGVGGWSSGWFAGAPAPIIAHYETARGQQSDVTLADGSTLHLNGATSIDVTIDLDRRQVALNRGEAYFDVAHEKERPFIVRAGTSTTQVLGTAFDVDMARGEVKLAVYRGRVRFGGTGTDARSVEVPAGWRSRFEGGVAQAPTRFDATQQDWRQDWLDTDDMRLADLVDALNRRGGPVILEPPAALASIALSGRFKLDKPRQLLGAIGTAYGFEVVAQGASCDSSRRRSESRFRHIDVIALQQNSFVRIGCPTPSSVRGQQAPERRNIMDRTKGLSLIALAAALAAPAMAQAKPVEGTLARQMRFDIGASDLRTAISQFSRATGVQVIVAPDVVAKRRTAGVRGAYSVREALDLMLRGTNLSASISDGVAVLKPVAATPAAVRRPVHAVREIAQVEGSRRRGAGNRERGRHRRLRLSPEPHPRAQDLKRRAVGSEDDILAQDIAAFPDLNLAESLQRVAGITITRDSGEGRQIALRGLGAEFTRTQLNGMEVLGNTASGMDNRGGVSRSRSFDYSLFASELFNRVSVQKSYAAEQDEGGIAGTVGLNTAKPFDYSGSKFVVSAKGQTNTNTSGITPRVVGLASGHWGDFGALASVAYSQIKSNEYGYRNWGWGFVKYAPGNIGPNIDAATSQLLQSGNIVAPQAESPSTWYTDRKRLGVTSSLQYHPGDRFKLDVDFLYGRLSDHRDDYAIASAGSNALTGATVNGGQIIQSAVIDGNTLRAASYTGIDQRSEHHIVENHTDFYQGVANASWKVTDRLTLTALGGYEESDFSQPVFDKVFMEAKNMAFSFDTRPTIPVNTYGKDLTDPNNWTLQRMDAQENGITSKYANGKLSAAFAATDALTFKAGGEFKHFSNSGYVYVNKVFHNVPANLAIPNNLKGVIGRDSLLPYIVGNVDGVYAYVGDPRDLSAKYLQAGSDYLVDEKTWSGFAQVDLDTQVGGMRLRGNAGLRYYSTDLTSSGHLTAPVNGVNTLVPVEIGTNSHGWLPAANLALDVAKDVVVRLSASRNVNRPALGDLAAAGTLTTRPNGGSASFGNPS